MSVTIIDAAADTLWHGTAGHRQTSLFSSPPWLAVLSRTYDLAIHAAVLAEQGRIVAGIPFSRVSDLRGERIVCLPFSDYCDPLVEDEAAWWRLVEPLLAAGVPVRLRCLRNDIPGRDPRFRQTGQGMWHGVDLERAEAEIWGSLEGSARQNIRKAERCGVVVREGRCLEDMLAFHALHCHLRKSKYRLLAQPVSFFENLHEIFSRDDKVMVLLAELDGKVVAGVLTLEWGDTLYYKFNASTDQHFRPNDLLMWHGIRLGRRRGLTRLDFGLSDPEQPGLIRYKRKFATEERTIAILQWWPEKFADPHGEQATRLLHRVTHLLTEPDVPDRITRAASDALYRFFC